MILVALVLNAVFSGHVVDAIARHAGRYRAGWQDALPLAAWLIAGTYAYLNW